MVMVTRMSIGTGNIGKPIALRLLGIPRFAATPLAHAIGDVLTQPLPQIRERVSGLDEAAWISALGDNNGVIYRKIWHILEGIES